METQDEKWGLFWCHLLHPIIFGEVDSTEEHAYMRKLSTEEILFPDDKRKKPSLSTLKRKLKEFRANGLHGLRRQARSDRGESRAVAQEIIDKAVELKTEQPLRSSLAINMFLEEMYAKRLSKSTLYRQGSRRDTAQVGDRKDQGTQKMDAREHARSLGGRPF